MREDAVSRTTASLAPAADIRTVAIASDHTGIELRKALVAFLRGRGLAVNDLGTDGTEPVDYPDVAASVARPVARGEADAGIVIDGAGIGSAIAANKIRGVRAVMATDRDHRALFARAQRRERADARRDAAHRGRSAGDRDDLADDADARAALHPPAGEDPRSRSADR